MRDRNKDRLFDVVNRKGYSVFIMHPDEFDAIRKEYSWNLANKETVMPHDDTPYTLLPTMDPSAYRQRAKGLIESHEKQFGSAHPKSGCNGSTAFIRGLTLSDNIVAVFTDKEKKVMGLDDAIELLESIENR